MMNKMTESARLNAIRERLKELREQGKLGIIAARAKVPEFMLHDWVESPVAIPGRDAIVDIDSAVFLETNK